MIAYRKRRVRRRRSRIKSWAIRFASWIRRAVLTALALAAMVATLAVADIALHRWRMSDVASAAIDAPTDSAKSTDTRHRTVRRLRQFAKSSLGENVAAQRRADYDAQRNKSVLDLQQFRTEQSIPIEMAPTHQEAGHQTGHATLVNLNPRVNSWYLLTLDRSDGSSSHHHLLNPNPTTHDIVLADDFPTGVVVVSSAGKEHCSLWSGTELDDAAGPGYRPLCDGRMILLGPTRGHRTTREWAAELLRDKVWGGETLTGWIKQALYKDKYRDDGELVSSRPTPTPPATDGPPPAAVDVDADTTRLSPGMLGLQHDAGDALAVGRWYPVNVADIWVSVIRPGLVAQSILQSHPDRVGALDAVEGDALAYLVAFDLAQFELGFVLGTDHPQVGWSQRVPEHLVDRSLSGPDGIDSIEPLVRSGSVPAQLAWRTVATFAGGFKRRHGGFRTGPFVAKNAGSHYGFVVDGVVVSKLQAGLSTLLATVDGQVEMKTWTEADDQRLDRIQYARQNGLAILERESTEGESVPGQFVASWGPGNWSGSNEGELRAVRAGACLQESANGRFLIYGYFSSATPSAMARVFQAYGCSHAMQLDMNALEHTYLALYEMVDDDLTVDHLVQGMDVLDQEVDGTRLPRFLAVPDNRDFFYLVRHDGRRR